MSDIDTDALKPANTVHQLKMIQSKELKALSKTAKGKALKEKEKELTAKHDQDMTELKKAWETFHLAEAGELPTEEKTEKAAEPESFSLYAEREVIVSKAAKKRLAREKREEEAKAKLFDELSQLPDMRVIEQDKLEAKMKDVRFDGCLEGKIGARIKTVKGDGHCLFRAILDQLSIHSSGSTPHTIESLRISAAEHIRANKEEFLPFLWDEADEDLMTLEEMDEYCDTLSGKTGKVVWGGHAEIAALSAVLAHPITVHIFDSSAVECGRDLAGVNGTLHVSYHKHIMDLGEHYNSVVPL